MSDRRRLCVRCGHVALNHANQTGRCAVADGRTLCPCLHYVRPAPRWLTATNRLLQRITR